jgi:polar amino acid transport system substrate-binding protein
MMPKKFWIGLLSLLLPLSVASASHAETVVEKVARTGVLTVGGNFQNIPYAYVNDKGDLVGFTVSLVNLIREQLQQDLGREVTVQIVDSTNVGDRISKLQSGDIDISCDTGFTWERDKYVDFSMSYSISGIKLLVPKNSALGNFDSLVGKRVGVIPRSAAEQTVKLYQPKAIIVPFNSGEESFAALKAGKVDAIAGDAIALEGSRQKLLPEGFQVVPKDPYALYGMSCMVPENNSTFLNRVNYTIAKLMQGYLNGAPEPTAMVNEWVGPQGIVPINPELIEKFFQSQLTAREQIPFQK